MEIQTRTYRAPASHLVKRACLRAEEHWTRQECERDLCSNTLAVNPSHLDTSYQNLVVLLLILNNSPHIPKSPTFGL